ncbi:protein spdB, partial [Streptomyces sp. NPDC049906]
TSKALTCVTRSVTPDVTPGVAPSWSLPVWGPTDPLPALEPSGAGTVAVLTDDALDVLVDAIRHSETPALSYREMSARFRAAGHSVAEVRLRAAWKRVAA